jgi:hypothetical protein
MNIRALRFLILSLVVGLAVATSNASTKTGLLGNPMFGFVDDLSVFEYGQDVQVQLNNGSSFMGPTGVYSTKGNTQVQLNNGSSISTLVLPSPFTGNLQLQSQNGSSIGTFATGNLAADAAAANKASAYFAGLTANSTVTGGKIELNGGMLTLTVPSSPAAMDTAIFSLQDINLNNASKITLVGDANAKFIFDISDQMQLNNASKIVLTGGVKASDVIFNFYKGNGSIQLNNGSGVTGTILAPGGQVQANNGSNFIVGAVISSKIQVNNGSMVVSAEF